MELFAKLIENLPFILLGIGFCLWSLARLVEARAKADSVSDGWDATAHKLSWAAEKYAEAIDWLVKAGAVNWSGGEKLARLMEMLRKFDKQWDAGNKKEAVAELIGYWMDAKNKLACKKQQIQPEV